MGLGWTLVRDEVGMEIALKWENAGKITLSTPSGGDEVVLWVGMKWGWPIKRLQPSMALAFGSLEDSGGNIPEHWKL